MEGLEGGGSLKQDRAELHTSFHSCVFIRVCCVSQELPSTVSIKTSCSEIFHDKRKEGMHEVWSERVFSLKGFSIYFELL